MLKNTRNAVVKSSRNSFLFKTDLHRMYEKYQKVARRKTRILTSLNMKIKIPSQQEVAQQRTQKV